MDRTARLEILCSKIRPLDGELLKLAKSHWDNIAKPLEGLGLLEEMITKIVAIEQSECISLKQKAVLIMCSDNGVIAAGVSQSDHHVTAIVAENFVLGITSVNQMAAFVGADIIPVDIGIASNLSNCGIRNCKIAYGTKNFILEPAMSREEALEGVLTGISLVAELKEKGYHLLGTGEMGIGNTTTSSAIASVLLQQPPEVVVGRGAGLSNEGMQRKIKAIKQGIALHQPDPKDPMAVLAAVGGFDIAGLVGVFLGGAIYRLPIVIDGMISAVAALLATRICAATVDYMLPSHVGKEPAGRIILDTLDLKPVINAELALGEGTGAVLLFPMLEMALQVYLGNNQFADIQIDAYKKFE